MAKSFVALEKMSVIKKRRAKKEKPRDVDRFHKGQPRVVGRKRKRGR